MTKSDKEENGRRNRLEDLGGHLGLEWSRSVEEMARELREREYNSSL